MTTRWDPFQVVHKKDIKNKNGEVVASVDYIGWAQAAERLDEAEEVVRWSFRIDQVLSQDCVSGVLTIVDKDGNESHFGNVGYAENAEMAWKKEPLKDAVSDCLKRCAALAGVARYLYEDSPKSGGRAAPPPARPSAPIPVRTPGTMRNEDGSTSIIRASVPEEPADLFPPIGGSSPAQVPTDRCPIHDVEWAGTPGDLWHKGPDGYCRHPDNVRKARRA